jgi:Carbon starvation protein, predicted membrane protein
MSALVILGAGAVIFLLAYHFYGNVIAGLWGVFPEQPTPAHTKQDGLD